MKGHLNGDQVTIGDRILAIGGSYVNEDHGRFSKKSGRESCESYAGGFIWKKKQD